jgi:hypothetical protein
VHGVLQTRAGAARGGGEFVEDSAEDHQGDLPVVSRLCTRERGQFASEALRDEVHEDLSKGLLFVASGG